MSPDISTTRQFTAITTKNCDDPWAYVQLLQLKEWQAPLLNAPEPQSSVRIANTSIDERNEQGRGKLKFGVHGTLQISREKAHVT